MRKVSTSAVRFRFAPSLLAALILASFAANSASAQFFVRPAQQPKPAAVANPAAFAQSDSAEAQPLEEGPRFVRPSLAAPGAEDRSGPDAAPATLSPSLNSAPAGTDFSDISDLITRGRALELDRRWGEALALYEEAWRTHREDLTLRERMAVARLHYDVERRYDDKSFKGVVTNLPASQALDLYSEVLLKIQTHYVAMPDWKDLLNQGAQSLDVAFSDPAFLRTSAPGAKPEAIEALRADMLSRIRRFAPKSRHEVREFVANLAKNARRQAGVLESALIFEFTCGAAGALDAYSTYLTPDQLSEVYAQIDGNFVGLGVELKAADGGLLIVKVITGSPAERAGIKANDRIVAVNGKTTQEISSDQAANMLQGPEGSTVEVTAISPGEQPRRVKIRREQVEIPSVDGVRIVDAEKGIGYLKLTCFQKTTSRDLDQALWALNRKGMKALVVDLRGNPGGLLTTSVEVVDRFIDRGVIVSTRGRSTSEDFSYSAHTAGTWRMPLTVLIDGESASASEIFAGAIRDYNRGTIVGDRSYGKGSVQGIFPLSIGKSGLRLTTAKFYSPKNLPFVDIGVSPDIAVRVAARPNLETGAAPVTNEDVVLNQALSLMKQQLTR